MRSPHLVLLRLGAARRRYGDGRRRPLSHGTERGRAVGITAAAAIVLGVALTGYASDTGVRDAGTAADLPAPADQAPRGPDETGFGGPALPAPAPCSSPAGVVLSGHNALGSFPATAGRIALPALPRTFTYGVPSRTGTARTLP
ncbi:hypothetical protein ACFRMN_33570 [Streptomyces sp. NPDC056835]|uniref:hypothetical protein n=1 Tax=Streptomyces sp. NPDC056835 TaxID=3345956 RepID=UPI0036B9440D